MAVLDVASWRWMAGLISMETGSEDWTPRNDDLITVEYKPGESGRFPIQSVRQSHAAPLSLFSTNPDSMNTHEDLMTDELRFALRTESKTKHTR